MPLDMKRKDRTLPNFTPKPKLEGKEGWEAPEHLSPIEVSEFTAAMANLDSFYGSIEVEWRVNEDDQAEFQNITWDVATDIHKRAIGRALNLWNKGTTNDAEQYTPDQWHDLFEGRSGWHVEIEWVEYDEDDIWIMETLTLTRE